jgi:hypothetical protein
MGKLSNKFQHKSHSKFHPRTAHEGPERHYCTFYITSAPDWGDNATSRPLYHRERDPVPTVQRAGWSPPSVRPGEENLTPTGFRSSERQAHRRSLYRPSYPFKHCCIERFISLFCEQKHNNNNNNTFIIRNCFSTKMAFCEFNYFILIAFYALLLFEM